MSERKMRVCFVARLLAVCMVCLSVSQCFSQVYSGRVIDGSGNPLGGVSVMVLDGNSDVAAFASSAGDGHFRVAVPEGRTAGALMFSLMGFAKDTVYVNRFRQGQTVVMREQALAIREVRVEAPRIREAGDTLTYLVNSFMQKQDRSIADVISHMPGLRVNGDGSIEYQGRHISGFYIEGMDMLGSKYVQASENIPAGKVKTVQVMENHQPVRMLRGKTFSDQAALNIVLTDEAKNVWQGTAGINAGTAVQGGASALGSCRLAEMMFARRMQSISIYKYDNTGKDILKEVASGESLDRDVPVESGMLTGISTDMPALDEERIRFDNSHLLATNWLFKTKADDDLRLQLYGLHDKSCHRQNSVTVYTDVAGGNVIAEDASADLRRSEIAGTLEYKANRDDYYLLNTFKGYADFNHGEGQTGLNGRETKEDVKTRKRYVSDKFTVMKSLDNGHSVTFDSYFSYNHLPGSLLLTDSTVQHLAITSAYWGAGAYVRQRVSRMYFTYALSDEGKTQELLVRGNGRDGRHRYTENNMRMSVSADWKNRQFRLNVGVPLVWLTRRLYGVSRSDVTVEPEVSASFEPTVNWQFMFSYSYSYRPFDLKYLYAAPVYTDYITLRQGTGDIDGERTHAVNGRAGYKNMVKGVFASLAVSYVSTGGNVLYENTVDGGVYASRATERRGDYKNLVLSGFIDKSFSRYKLNIGVRGLYMRNGYSLLILDEAAPFVLNTARVSADISLQPTSWLSVEENSGYSYSKRKVPSYLSPLSSSSAYFNHRLSLHFMPGKWDIELSNEIYHSNDRTVSFNYFSDLEVCYREKSFEVSLAFSNIFDNERYERKLVADSYGTYTSTRLRPREITAGIVFGF